MSYPQAQVLFFVEEVCVKKRPLSPHIQVYKWQITSVLSILHRGTGVALSIGIFLFSWWLTCVVLGDEYYAMPHIFFTSPLGKLFLFGWTWALFYHLSNGIRHLFWNAGKGFELSVMRLSGWAVVLSSFFLTFGVWWVSNPCLCSALKGCHP